MIEGWLLIMNKKGMLSIATAVVLGLGAAGCGSNSSAPAASTKADTAATEAAYVANKDKPLTWFNRQPSNSSTGELDKDALNYNANTYYVGFDANQGAELQGQMVADYIQANADTIDRNGDGIIGYVLAIGDIGHNDSIARTRGVRKALGTAVEKDGAIDSQPVGTNVDCSGCGTQSRRQDLQGSRAGFSGNEELCRRYMGCGYSR